MRLKEVLDSPSKALAMSLAVFCFGILFGSFVPFFWWQGLLLMGMIFFCVASLVRNKERRFLFFLCAIFVLALFRYTQAFLPPDVPSVAHVSSSAIRVSGRVRVEVERRIDTQRIVLDQVLYADESREGKVLVWAPLYPEIGYGDDLVFNCAVKKPEAFEGFAYDRYLASKGILAVCFQPQFIDVHPSESASLIGFILEGKQRAMNRLQRLLPEPNASFVSGLLFGGSTALSSDLKDDFSATGTSHILAASGFNVSLFSVSFLALLFATPLGRRRSLVLTSVLLCVYVVMAGAGAAVVRAGIMGGLVVVEKLISRKAFMLNAFLLTGSVMLLFNPLLLLYDVGFQLSFVATMAVIVFTKPVSKRLLFVPDVFALRESFAGSLCAIVLTLPIVLWHFGQVSLVAPFANLLVLPLVVYTMGLGAITILVGWVWMPIATMVAVLTWAVSQVMLTTIVLFGSIRFALVEPSSSRLLAVFIAFGLAIFLYTRRYDSYET